MCKYLVFILLVDQSVLKNLEIYIAISISGS